MTTRPTPEAVTEIFKWLDLELARVHGDISQTLAGCHLGLGVRMLRELGFTIEDIVALAKSIGGEIGGAN